MDTTVTRSIRIEHSLRQRIQDAADKDQRSWNAMAVMLLERSLGPGGAVEELKGTVGPMGRGNKWKKKVRSVGRNGAVSGSGPACVNEKKQEDELLEALALAKPKDGVAGDVVDAVSTKTVAPSVGPSRWVGQTPKPYAGQHWLDLTSEYDRWVGKQPEDRLQEARALAKDAIQAYREAQKARP